MRRHPRFATGVALLALGAATVAGAQQPGHGGGGHHAGPVPAHQAVQAYLTEFEQVVREGRGFGMAFPADQNGYPGPMHALELKDRLRLTSEQETKLQALLDGMFAESRPTGARLLDAEAKLTRLFAAAGAEEASVRAAVAEVERARSELRLVHLLTHLRTRDLLTEAQRRQYHEARWGR